MKHKHADIIHAWADGAKVQYKESNGQWYDTAYELDWNPNIEYRIKPEEKKPVVRWMWAYKDRGGGKYCPTAFLTETEAFNLSVQAIKLEWSRTEFPE